MWSGRTGRPNTGYRSVVIRRLLMVAIFLLLGAVLNVAVAWGCAAWLEPVVYKTTGLGGRMLSSRTAWCEADRTMWLVTLSKSTGARRVETRVLKVNADPSVWIAAVTPQELADVGLPRWSHLFDGLPGQVNRLTEITQTARGWPMLAMRYERWSQGKPWRFPNPRPPPVVGMVGGFDLRCGGPSGPNVILPLQPVWVGFLGNTLCYASAWWGLCSTPAPIRRWVRRRRGQCPTCGYDLRGNVAEGCPECGWQRAAVS